jgi:hypothetical protein
MNVTKILAVVLPVGAVASFGVPAILDKQKRDGLSKQFQSALQTHDKVRFSAGGKQGRLSWPNEVSSLDPSELPTIPGGVFVMKPGESYVIGSRLQEKPAEIHSSFFELDDALRASSPSDIRTLVHAKTHHLTTRYREEDGGPAAVRILNQRVIKLHIYDLEERKCVGVWTLAGQRPPRGFRSDKMPDLAPPPSVAKFLEALPRR